MKNSDKFNSAQHESEELRVEGFEGLHYVDVAGDGTEKDTGEYYTYTGRIALLDECVTLRDLKKRVEQFVTFLVSLGDSEEEAITQAVTDVNHAWNIRQRAPFRPGVNAATGAKEVNKLTSDALKSGVSKEALMEAIAQAKAKHVSDEEVV